MIGVYGYPLGFPDAGSVKIITLSTSPNLLKCRERLSLEAAKWTCVLGQLKYHTINKKLQDKNSTHIIHKYGPSLCIFHWTNHRI